MKTNCIFIIEDNKIFRKITQQVLQNSLKGHIVAFASAEEAIQELDEYDPQLILLDHKLDARNPKNMSGLEFLRKRRNALKQRPIIVMSGQQDKNITTSLLKTGAVNYLNKESESFFANLVNEVNHQLDFIKLRSVTNKQKKSLRKQLWRIMMFILIPLVIIGLILTST